MGSLQAGRAEAVDGVGAGGVWDAGGQGGGAHDVGGFAVGDVAECDVFDKGWVDVGLLDDLLKEGVDEVVEGGVLEAALLRLGQGGAASVGDDDIISILAGAVVKLSASTPFLILTSHRFHSIEYL